MTYEAFRNAKTHYRSICATWVDLANAYGSIRHMQLQFSLRWYYVPIAICELMFRYYEGLAAQVHTDTWTSNWIFYEIGVPQGCTASTINFDIAFQPILDATTYLAGVSGYTFKEADLTVPTLTYADDVQFLTSTPLQARKCIHALEQALDWSVTLRPKPSKCRTLAFKLFRNEEKSKFKKIQETAYSCFDPLLNIGNEKIGFVGHDNPPCFKYLGRWLQFDMKDGWVRDTIESKFRSWLDLVDKPHLLDP